MLKRVSISIIMENNENNTAIHVTGESVPNRKNNMLCTTITYYFNFNDMSRETDHFQIQKFFTNEKDFIDFIFLFVEDSQNKNYTITQFHTENIPNHWNL